MSGANRAVTASPEPPVDLGGRRVVVMGLGLFGGGAGASRFLARHGANVLVTDLRDAEALRDSLDALDDVDLEYRLGEHRFEDFDEADLIVANPAVPPTAPILERARQRGIPVESEISLFLRRTNARVVGITGSNGKTTTTTLMGEIFRECGKSVVVGGNVGGSILDRSDEIGADDVVVLELSSFQGEDLHRIGRSPHLSVVLNLTPNHLDRHGTLEAYGEAKRSLMRYQNPGDVAFVCADDPGVRDWTDGRGRKLYFSRERTLEEGLFLRDGRAVARLEGSETDLFGVTDLRLLGRFNQSNALAAAGPPLLLGCDPAGIQRAVEGFRGVEHRLELVAEIDGVSYYNDSIATTPESAIAALTAVDGDKWLICGGYDKKIDLDGLGETLAREATGVALIGQTADAIAARIRATVGSAEGPALRLCADLGDAVRWIASQHPRGAVLLSPGCASFDQFPNFAERGRAFRRFVRALESPVGEGLEST